MEKYALIVGAGAVFAYRDLCKIPICGEFLRCALLARLLIYLICLHSLCCYASNFIPIWIFCKGLCLSENIF